MRYVIYTDGSYRSSENMGGYGVVVFKDKDTVVFLKQEQRADTTNNQMELEGVLQACKYISETSTDDEYLIYSDSQYCVKAINEWRHTWKENGWKTSKRKEVKNKDLMEKLDNYFTYFDNIQIKHIDGHDGEVGNELADALATHNIKKFKDLILKNNLKVEY